MFFSFDSPLDVLKELHRHWEAQGWPASTSLPEVTGEQMKGKSFKEAMSASTAAKEARAGKDMGKPGKGFAKVAAKATDEYGSAAAGKKVAGAVFNRMRKSGKL